MSIIGQFVTVTSTEGCACRVGIFIERPQLAAEHIGDWADGVQPVLLSKGAAQSGREGVRHERPFCERVALPGNGSHLIPCGRRLEPCGYFCCAAGCTHLQGHGRSDVLSNWHGKPPCSSLMLRFMLVAQNIKNILVYVWSVTLTLSNHACAC